MGMSTNVEEVTTTQNPGEGYYGRIKGPSDLDGSPEGLLARWCICAVGKTATSDLAPTIRIGNKPPANQ